MFFIHIFKVLFEKIFISVLTHGYALTLTFLFYSSPVC
ncbi:membrane protein [Salmonella enterica subsp. enterica serovar Bareilly str. CFSAN000754]|nr:membrane protein [Salmonella enterica subsp. enterica serovar Bareilly str. CFSAN000754]